MRHMSRALDANVNHPELATAIAAFARAKILYENSRPEPTLRRLVCHCEAFDRYRERVIASLALAEFERAGGVVEAAGVGGGVPLQQHVPVPVSVPVTNEENEYLPDAEEQFHDDIQYVSAAAVEYLERGAPIMMLVDSASGKQHATPAAADTIHAPDVTSASSYDLDDEDYYEDDEDDSDDSVEDDSDSSDDSWTTSDTSCSEACECDGEDRCRCEGHSRKSSISSAGGNDPDHPHTQECRSGIHQEEDVSRYTKRNIAGNKDGDHIRQDDDDDDFDMDEDDYDSDFEELTAEMQKLIIAIPWEAHQEPR